MTFLHADQISEFEWLARLATSLTPILGTQSGRQFNGRFRRDYAESAEPVMAWQDFRSMHVRTLLTRVFGLSFVVRSSLRVRSTMEVQLTCQEQPGERNSANSLPDNRLLLVDVAELHLGRGHSPRDC